MNLASQVEPIHEAQDEAGDPLIGHALAQIEQLLVGVFLFDDEEFRQFGDQPWLLRQSCLDAFAADPTEPHVRQRLY